jgi:hypothetical protein
MSQSSVGWGAGEWGSSPWGGGGPGALQLVNAVAVAENAVQLEFTRSVYFSQLLDPHDASRPGFYTITPVPGTVGLDGTLARAVSVAQVDAPAIPGFFPAQILQLTLDRPMTPYAAMYVVALSPLIVSSDMLQPLDPTMSSYQYAGVFKSLERPQVKTPTATRDFANPQTLSGAIGGGPIADPFNPALLGTLRVDDTGDYSFDQGINAFKKRMLRRLVTLPGGFLHLGDGYGVGVTSFSKRLGLAAVREKLAADAEIQIAREPEVDKVKVTGKGTQDGLFRLTILVRLRAGGQRRSQRFDVDFPVT